MDDWAQEAGHRRLSFHSVIRPPTVHGGRRSADRIPEEAGLRLREWSWYMPRWLGRLLLNITIEPPRDRQAGHRRTPGTG